MTSAGSVSGVTFDDEFKKKCKYKTKTMIFSRPCTIYPQSHLLTISGAVLNKSDDLEIWKGHLIPRSPLRSILRSIQSSFERTLYLEDVLASIP